jgi:MOSC domain-containing protein YiiM
MGAIKGYGSPVLLDDVTHVFKVVSMPSFLKNSARAMHMGIWKDDPILGRFRVGRVNLVGHGQCDLADHGGEHRAVFVYQIESYRYWQGQLSGTDFVHGQFRENFTVEGLPDDAVCLGALYQTGSAAFEVTQPRVPCYRAFCDCSHSSDA